MNINISLTKFSRPLPVTIILNNIHIILKSIIKGKNAYITNYVGLPQDYKEGNNSCNCSFERRPSRQTKSTRPKLIFFHLFLDEAKKHHNKL